MHSIFHHGSSVMVPLADKQECTPHALRVFELLHLQHGGIFYSPGSRIIQASVQDCQSSSLGELIMYRQRKNPKISEKYPTLEHTFTPPKAP